LEISINPLLLSFVGSCLVVSIVALESTRKGVVEAAGLDDDFNGCVVCPTPCKS
jgi:hypothetical protein